MTTALKSSSPTARRVAPRLWSQCLGALERVENAEALDRVAAPLRKAVRALPLGPLRDVLHGRRLGHPLHPVLVQVPMGAWLSSVVLDFVPGAGRPARVLVGVGTLTALPAALAGWTDWAQQGEREMRTGLVHAAANVGAVTLFGASFAVRGRRPVAGRCLGAGGLACAGVGGFIGGHLAYRQGAGANKAASVVHLVEPGWHPVGPVARLTPGKPEHRMLGEVPLLVVRGEDGTVHALADRCSHLSGSLSSGDVHDGCVTCPWHGSEFRLSDGAVVRGPATAPQPRFETRIEPDGVLAVRLPGAG
ncbi:Rieske 2Fe-2S domain-containing protein [Streptomyces roseirectus]|uniref:Rieske 2Fe-2S domain-containing protein n=1 Tax=Streptomyces roseirectus TaxID=2768066 RepID=A0A7H0IPP7_9ACTN|nr:Rieske 2Fe-2S domain-containing protein [Streptomyces roseirectus]QNP74763.1 Rieske 2Fe-2S domain-containing protein [Streptomyces roseirectus]